MNYYTLPNGIRCIHRQVRSAVAHCALTVNTESRDELEHEQGLAHLLEHAFFKGTTHRKAYHINCRLENLGGELNAYTTKEETVIHTTSLRGDVAKAAELIADIVFCSTFPAHELEKEKEVIVDEINSYKDSPADRIFDDFEDLIFAGSSLGHNILGRKKDLMHYGTAELNRFILRTYNTDQMVFSVSGNFSERRFRMLCDRYLGDVPATHRTFRREGVIPYTPFTQRISRRCYQSHCLLGGRAYHLNDERRVILSLLINLLGGPSANSLLNLAIRERNGLSYNIEANYSPFSDTGLASIYFSSDREKSDECLELVAHELHRIQEGNLSDHLLRIAQKQYLGQITIAMENNENYMLNAARSYLIYNSIDDMEAIRRKILSVSRTSIIEVAREVFGEENLSTLIYY
ncbi:MAG: pitrilysin family protein [Alistipes sp.]|nr:pitrilysin family protein [Alistipes sp.]